MSWYKDRSFPELKRETDNGPNEILATIPNVADIERVINAHNEELNEILKLAEDWKKAYNDETTRLKIKLVEAEQIKESLEKELKDVRKSKE